MSLENKLKDSTLSLQGNGFDPQPLTPSFGYSDTSKSLDPKLSKLQFTYDVDSNPKITVNDFNKSQYKSIVPPESTIDELDLIAPNNLQAGKKGSVVSQIYKSSTGQKYKDKGPVGGRY